MRRRTNCVIDVLVLAIPGALAQRCGYVVSTADNRLLHRDKLVRSETITPTEESKRNSDKTQNFIEGERSEKTMHAAKPRHQNEELVLRTVPVVLKNGS